MPKHKSQKLLSLGPGIIQHKVDHNLDHKLVYKVDPHFRELFNEVEKMIQEGKLEKKKSGLK